MDLVRELIHCIHNSDAIFSTCTLYNSSTRVRFCRSLREIVSILRCGGRLSSIFSGASLLWRLELLSDFTTLCGGNFTSPGCESGISTRFPVVEECENPVGSHRSNVDGFDCTNLVGVDVSCGIHEERDSFENDAFIGSHCCICNKVSHYGMHISHFISNFRV